MPGAEGGSALWRHAVRQGRRRALWFAGLFAVYAYIQPAGYRHTYPTLDERAAFAASLGNAKALRLLYGEPYDLLSTGGYAGWRVGGVLALAAAAFGLLASVAALRGEEEAGRIDLILSGTVGRGTATASALLATAAATGVLATAELAGLLLGGLAAGGALCLALATVSLAAVGVGVGAIVSQLASTRRAALGLGAVALVIAFAARVVADTLDVGWLRWLTPFGWAEEVRPFAGARPLVLLLPAAVAGALLAGAARLARERDIGSGLIARRDSAPPLLRLLGSPTSHAFRDQRTLLAAWAIGMAIFMFILGTVADAISTADVSTDVQDQLEKLGPGAITTPSGYLGFVFLFVIVVVSAFACGEVSRAREEEATLRLETLLAHPVARSRWLAGRLAIAAVAILALSLTAGTFAWAGAATAGSDLPPSDLLKAGINVVPCAVLFLGITALAYATAPRAGLPLAYSLLAVLFLWQLIGSLFEAPDWLLAITPFAHVGLVPAEPMQVKAAVVITAVGLGTALAAMVLFRRRDLVSD